MKEIERLKAELEISEAVEKYMTYSEDLNDRIAAHYREGKVIDGKWVRVEEDSDDDDSDEEEEEDEKEKKEEERDYSFDCHVCGKRFYDDGTDKHETCCDDEGGRCVDCGPPIDSDDDYDSDDDCVWCVGCGEQSVVLKKDFHGDELCEKCYDPDEPQKYLEALADDIADRLLQSLMLDAVNRAKPCKKNQCHAMTKKGFRCKYVAGGMDFCKKHIPCH